MLSLEGAPSDTYVHIFSMVTVLRTERFVNLLLHSTLVFYNIVTQTLNPLNGKVFEPNTGDVLPAGATALIDGSRLQPFYDICS